MSFSNLLFNSNVKLLCPPVRGFWGCDCVLLAAVAKPARPYYATPQAYPYTPSLFFLHFFPFLSISHQDLRDQTFPSEHKLYPESPLSLKRGVLGEGRWEGETPDGERERNE